MFIHSFAAIIMLNGSFDAKTKFQFKKGNKSLLEPLECLLSQKWRF